MEFSPYVQKILDRQHEMETIVCPHCDCHHEQSEDPEFYYSHIHYHGSEDGPVETNCWHCDKVFFVYEMVERTYEGFKTEQDFIDR